MYMEQYESEINELQSQIELPEVYTDYKKLTDIQTQIDELKEKQSVYEEEWEKLMLEIE